MEKHVTKTFDWSFYPQNKQAKSKAIKPPPRRSLWCSYVGLDYLHQVFRFCMEKLIYINSKYKYKNLRNVDDKRESDHTVLCCECKS